MSSQNLNIFLKALEVVKQDYTCRICLEMGKKPVNLKACFHLICEEHLNNVVKCPTCKKPLLDTAVIKNNKLEASIDSAKKLNKVIAPLKTNTRVSQKSNVSVASKVSKKKIIKKPIASKINRDEYCEASTSYDNKAVREYNQNTSLLSAASSSKNNTVEKINYKGETALHVACNLCKVDNVVELLKKGANPNTRDKIGWTPLHRVVQNGKLVLVKILLQNDALVNAPGNSNETPLHEAVRYNRRDIVEELVRHGADLYARNSKGETPVDISSPKINNAGYLVHVVYPLRAK